MNEHAFCKKAFGAIAPASQSSEPSNSLHNFTAIFPVPDHASDVFVAAGRVTGLGRKADHIWAYKDKDGHPNFYVARWNKPDRSKEIRPICWTKSEQGIEAWRSMRPPGPLSLYGLEKLALFSETIVVVTEGEKAADAAQRVFADCAVLTSVGGSNAAKQSDWSAISGREVLIWPDHDEAGTKYASEVAEILHSRGCSVRIIDVASLLNARATNIPPPIDPNGWDVADALEQGWDPEVLRSLALEKAQAWTPGPAFVSWGPFVMDKSGLTEGTRDEKREPTKNWICEPFEVLGRVRETSGHGWGRLIQWVDADGRSHTAIVADAELHAEPAHLTARLAQEGLKINTAAKSRQRLLAYLNGANSGKRVTVVPRTGWHLVQENYVFVMPDGTVGNVGDEKVLLRTTDTSPYKKGGSLVGWRESVAQSAATHSRMILAISASLAGPLLRIAGMDGSGIHFFGASSIGKSTLADVAASVWGPPKTNAGFVRTWRATANAMEGMAAAHTDTVLVLDEMGQVDPREAAAIPYALVSGTGKGRAARNGDLRQAKTFRVMLLSTGELCLADKLAENKGQVRAGQEIRLLNLPADAGKGCGVFDRVDANGAAKMADQFKSATAQNYGHAGPEFVRLLLDNMQQASNILEQCRLQFSQLMQGADGQVLRAADTFALLAAAGELAIALGLVP